MNEKKQKYIALFLVALAVFLCFWGLNYGLPHLAHDDEQTFVKRALRFGNGDLNPHYFLYPPLMMYALFFVYGVYYAVCHAAGIFSTTTEFAHAYINDPTAVYLLGRGLVAFFAVATVMTLYYRMKKTLSLEAGLFSALILLAFPRFPDSAHIIKSDMMMFLGSAIFFGLILDIYKDGRTSRYALAGLALGLTAAAKYNAAVLAPLVILASFLRMREHGSGALRQDLRKSLFDPKLLLFVVCVVGGFVLGNPYSVLDFATFRRDIVTILTFTALDEEFGGGGAAINYIRVIFYMGGRYPFLGVLCVAGGLAAFVSRKKEMILAAAAVIMVYAMCATLSIQQWHYFIPALPFLVSLGGYAADGIWRVSRSNKAGRIVFIGVFAALIAEPMARASVKNYWFTRPDVRVIAKKWIEDNIPEGSKMLIDNRGPMLARTKGLLKKQYEDALRLNHLKKDYFKLQLDAHRGKEYEWYNIERSIIGPRGAIEYSQSVELNVNIEGATAAKLKKQGFRYLVLVPPERPTEEEKKFDSSLVLLKEFAPENFVSPLNFRVKIYKIY
ncbi:MAG: glycosyltransferase family 39 protein [Endomicrobiia bacterium]|nr:glycosyltransferase family 39 protein [Endomicrobiia bacterium]